MGFFLENFSAIFISLGLAIFATLFWLYFWYYYSKKYTTPSKFLLKGFFLGILGAFLAFLLERVVLSGLLSRDLFLVFQQEKALTDLSEIILVFGLVFFLTALPEELLKFLFFKFSLFKSQHFNQIIDGIKFGIAVGLGFALVENTYFFQKQLSFSPLNTQDLFSLFLFRLFITTLAHSLYGGVLGYYFGLARFYKVFKNIFLWQGFLSVVIFHTFFNFLVLTPLNILTFLLLILTLIILMKWYTDRKNFQILLSQKLPQKAKPPILTEQKEMQALIAEGTKSNFRIVRKLGLCPFCFKRIKKEEEHCHYCGRRIG